MMVRKTKDLPKHFQKAKVEFDKLLNTFWFTRQIDGKRDESKENLALLYSLIEEYNAFVQKHFFLIGEKLLETLEKDKIAYNYDYNIAIEYDSEAKWLFKREITAQEWREYDAKCNEDFLKGKK